MVAVSLKKLFFKQKTAYEIMPSLVGSEMCIRDRDNIYEKLCPYVERAKGGDEQAFEYLYHH